MTKEAADVMQNIENTRLVPDSEQSSSSFSNSLGDRVDSFIER